MDINSGLDLIYENMKGWYDYFPNLDYVSVVLSPDNVKIMICWKDNLKYTYTITRQALEQQVDISTFGDMIIYEAEKEYKIATVGEE